MHKYDNPPKLYVVKYRDTDGTVYNGFKLYAHCNMAARVEFREYMPQCAILGVTIDPRKGYTPVKPGVFIN